MSETDKPLRKSTRKWQCPNEESQLSEQFLIYRNRRSGYVSELIKLINGNWNMFGKQGDYENCSENIITKFHCVTTKLIDLVSKDL